MKRDPEFFKKLISIKDGALHFNDKVIIEYPKWYANKEMADIGEAVSVYGVVAFISGERYAVSIVPSRLECSPVAINEIDRDGETYLQLFFGKGDKILNKLQTVRNTISSYNYFESFYMRGKFPWYIEPEDNIRIMDNMLHYAGSKMGDNYIANELLASFVTRSAKDKTLFYRQTDMRQPYEYVELMNVYYSATSTATKLAGNYMSNSINSALVQRSKKATKLEQHLKE